MKFQELLIRKNMKKNIGKLILILMTSLSLAISPVFANPDESAPDISNEIETAGTENETAIEEEDAFFESSVRVGLKYGSSAVSSYTFFSESGFYVADVKEGKVVENLPVSAYTSVILSSEGGAVVLKGDDGNVLLQDFGASVLLPMDYADGGIVTVNGKPYRDGMKVTKNASGTLNLINLLNTEHYVYGVLNAEMYHDNPIEALKAQAVAARSFAELNSGRHEEYGFDLCTGTHCQVYRGYSDEYEETNLAADETAGICMYYNDAPVSAYYFKNSGGYTQNIKDVWGSSLGYLKAVEDPYSPDYPWSVTYTFDEIESKLSAAGNNVGTLESIEIVSRNESGAVDTLRFTGTSGTATLTRERIRTFFGTSIIKSTMFSFEDAETGTVERENSSENPGDTGKVSRVNGSLSVLNADGTVTSLENIKLSVINWESVLSSVELDNTVISNGEDKVEASLYFNKKSNEDTNKKDDDGIIAVSEYVTESPVTFIGKGYGHGIGMPQDSAIEMAKQGFAFDEILKYYYTGIELK